MLSKLRDFILQQRLFSSGDRVTVAVSGGADSIALLFALYLLRDTMPFELAAAHFNHNLRGEESDRDEKFVRDFCARYDIPLTVGQGDIKRDEKGLESAARKARYAFLDAIPGVIATAHTADDNAETILMHLIRGTGLKGLGGIRPVNGRIVRPMLTITRAEVEAFLEDYYLPHIEDSSNHTDQFLRNRIRHNVMPFLREENPRISQNLTAMALNLRQDAQYLYAQLQETMPSVSELEQLHPALQNRYVERFLKNCGVPEPEQLHIQQVRQLIYQKNPSASVQLPCGVTVGREYNRLIRVTQEMVLEEKILLCPGRLELPRQGIVITAEPASDLAYHWDSFPVQPDGMIRIRSRKAGDTIRLHGGTKSLKKLFIDSKVPAAQRGSVPVVCDDGGVLGVYQFGANLDRLSIQLPAIRIQFHKV